jgi:hypothetical protein
MFTKYCAITPLLFFSLYQKFTNGKKTKTEWLYYTMLSLDKTDRVIISLKVIATLQEGQRLCVRNGQFSVYTEGWTQAFTRWMYSENRWVNYEDVQNVMNEAFCILGTYMNLTNQSTDGFTTPANSLTCVATLAKELNSAAGGLLNLKKTYADDPLMVATLDVLTERTAVEVAKAQKILRTSDAPSPAPLQPCLTAPHTLPPPKAKAIDR